MPKKVDVIIPEVSFDPQPIYSFLQDPVEKGYAPVTNTDSDH